MQNISFLVLDDDRLNRDFVMDLIEEFVPNSSVVEASTVSDGKSIIKSHNIDVVFLDIKLPEGNGFNLLEARNDFIVIFITAYSEYAIKAIKAGAFDYILKPIKIDEFKESILKAVDYVKNRRVGQYSSEVLHGQEKLAIASHSGTVTLDLWDIVYLSADNTYTTIITSSGKEIVSSKPIAYYEKLLATKNFIRIHKSYIINLMHMKERNTLKRAKVKFSNGKELPLARSRNNKLSGIFKNFLR